MLRFGPGAGLGPGLRVFVAAEDQRLVPRAPPDAPAGPGARPRPLRCAAPKALASPRGLRRGAAAAALPPRPHRLAGAGGCAVAHAKALRERPDREDVKKSE